MYFIKDIRQNYGFLFKICSVQVALSPAGGTIDLRGGNIVHLHPLNNNEDYT